MKTIKPNLGPYDFINCHNTYMYILSATFYLTIVRFWEKSRKSETNSGSQEIVHSDLFFSQMWVNISQFGLFLAVVRYKLGIARGKKSELWEVAVNKPDVNKFPYELTFWGGNVINRLNYLIHTIYHFSFVLILKWNITQTWSWLFNFF